MIGDPGGHSKYCSVVTTMTSFFVQPCKRSPCFPVHVRHKKNHLLSFITSIQNPNFPTPSIQDGVHPTAKPDAGFKRIILCVGAREGGGRDGIKLQEDPLRECTTYLRLPSQEQESFTHQQACCTSSDDSSLLHMAQDRAETDTQTKTETGRGFSCGPQMGLQC